MRARPCFLIGAGYAAVASFRFLRPTKHRARGTPDDKPRPRPRVTGEFFSHTSVVTANAAISSVPRAVFEDVARASPGGGSLYPPLFRPPAGWGSRGFRLPFALTSRARRPPPDRLLPRVFKRAASAGSGCAKGRSPPKRRRTRPAPNDADQTPRWWGGMDRNIVQ